MKLAADRSGKSIDNGLELLGGFALHGARIAANDSDLDIIAVDTVLHNVLQRLKDHLLGLVQSHSRVILFFQRRHGCLLTCTNCIGLPFSVGAGWVCRIKLWATLIHATNQECDTVWPGHRLPLAAFVALSEVDSDVRDALSDRFDTHWLIEVESVVLSFHSAMVDENTGITHNSTHGASTMTVHFDELFAASLWHHELGRLQFLFNTENHTLVRLYTDCCGTKLSQWRKKRELRLMFCFR